MQAKCENSRSSTLKRGDRVTDRNIKSRQGFQEPPPPPHTAATSTTWPTSRATVFKNELVEQQAGEPGAQLLLQCVLLHPHTQRSCSRVRTTLWRTFLDYGLITDKNKSSEGNYTWKFWGENIFTALKKKKKSVSGREWTHKALERPLPVSVPVSSSLAGLLVINRLQFPDFPLS